jgi:hypothetical protein
LEESWSNGQWVNSWRETHTYDAQGNLTAIWIHSWVNATWTPVNTYYGWSVADSAGNDYEFIRYYNLTLTYKPMVINDVSEHANVHASYTLSQNFPNPFNPSTTIKFELPKASEVRLNVYDLLGREASVLVNDRRDAGVYEVKFDATGLSSGVYFYRIQAGDFIQTKRLLLLK